MSHLERVISKGGGRREKKKQKELEKTGEKKRAGPRR